MEDMCCTMIDSNHCHRFACSIMLQLGSRAPIVIKWPAVVLVIWPHFNGNAQRRPRSASLGLALFSSRICWFLCTSNGYPRGKSNRPRGCQKISVQIPCFLVSSHWRFFCLLACLAYAGMAALNLAAAAVGMRAGGRFTGNALPGRVPRTHRGALVCVYPDPDPFIWREEERQLKDVPDSRGGVKRKCGVR